MVIMTFSNSSSTATSVWFRRIGKGFRIYKKLIQNEEKIKENENEIKEKFKDNSVILGFDPPSSTINVFSLNHHVIYRIVRMVLFISSQSLNLWGRRGTTVDVATIPFHPSPSSAAIRESPNPIPVHSLMLSSHLLFCLPLLLAPFNVTCRTVFAMPADLEMWPYHLSFRFLAMIRRPSCTPVALWTLLRTSSFVTWSL